MTVTFMHGKVVHKCSVCYIPPHTRTQHALRLIAFQKLHLVLGVQPLPPPGTPKTAVKREAADEQQEGEDNEAKKPKLDA